MEGYCSEMGFGSIAYYGPKRGGWGEIRETARTKDRRVASKLLAARIQEVRNHRTGLARFAGPTQRKLAVHQVLDDLLKRMEMVENRSLRTAVSQLRRFRAEFGTWQAVEITTSRLREYQLMRLNQGAAKATVDRELELVHRAFRLAFEGEMVFFVPTIKKLQKQHANARQGFLKPEEFFVLLDHIEDQDFRDWLLWFWWTGMRNAETSSLRWHEFEDGDPPIVTLLAENAKIGEVRKLPIVGPLREIIDRRIERAVEGCPFVFHRSAKSFRAKQGGLPNWCYEVWNTACTAVGLSNLRPYDLRRSASRNLIHAGVPELTAMKITGHKSRETFRRYAIEDPSELASAIERVAAYASRRKRSPARVLPFPKGLGNADETRTRRT